MSRTVSPRQERKPSFALRMSLMLVGVAVVFGGVLGVKALMSSKTNEFFDNMPQPPVQVSTFRSRPPWPA